MSCEELAPDEHEVFRALAPKLNHKSRIYRVTVNNLAETLGQSRRHARTCLQALEECGLLRVDETGRILATADPCRCDDFPAKFSRARTVKQKGFSNSHSPLRGELAETPSGPLARAREAATGDQGEPESRVRRVQRVQRLSAYRLAEDFEARARMTFFGKCPGGTNKGALRAAFARWERDDGISFETIQAMLDVFFAEKRLPPRKEPWRAFLNQRQDLFDKACRRLQAAEQRRAVAAGDRSGWDWKSRRYTDEERAVLQQRYRAW